ncbi:MAG: acetate--CoA ligase family protein [Candidatus Krumholzibacteriia bacterium]
MRQGLAQRLDEVLAAAWADGTGETAAAGAQVRLNEAEVYALLDGLGVARSPAELLHAGADGDARAAWAAAAAHLAEPHGKVVLKVCGRDILHKSEVGGVAVTPVADGAAGLLAAADRLMATVRPRVAAGRLEGVLACAWVPHQANLPGQELLLSLRQDPAFGPVVIVGVGGLLTEWYGRGTAGRSRLIFAATDLQAPAVAAALRAHPLLGLAVTPSRLYPTPPLEAEVVGEAVAALAVAATRLGADGDGPWTLEEIEINPAVVAGGRLVALDGVGLLSRRRWTAARRPLAKIGPLLAPRSAVVMGVSARGDNPGRIILRNLLASACVERGRLAVIHPDEATIEGVPCFPGLAALPWKADLAVIALPAAAAAGAIRELVAGDQAESVILIPGGFAETGAHELAAEIERTLEAGHAAPGGGPVLVGGNCLGIVSRDRYNTFFLPPYKLPFRPGLGDNLALVSQSGAYLVTFASNYDGIILPRASISFGNQMDLTVSDFLAHFADDPEIGVVACYVEGFRAGDGARFLTMARTCRARGQRVIVFKAGRTALGAQAAASHTASLAGDYAVAHACLTAAGVTVAESLDEFEDLIKTFTLLHARPAAGRRVGILSNAGFECATATDVLDGLRLAAFDVDTRAALDAALPSYAHRDNPIDATPIAGTDGWARAAGAVLACPEVDCAILSAVPVTPALDNLPRDPQGRHAEDLDAPGSQAGRMLELWRRDRKPWVAVVDAGPLYDPLASRLERGGVPVFRKIDRAVRALAAFCVPD